MTVHAVQSFMFCQLCELLSIFILLRFFISFAYLYALTVRVEAF